MNTIVKPDEEEYDFERLRKKITAVKFADAFTYQMAGDFGDCVNAYEASPEQLLRMAKRYNINLDKFKKKK